MRCFSAGLFASHPGTARSVPIVRLGNIAAWADEPQFEGRIERWVSTPAHLVEVRSLNGLSGSPVFVFIGPIRNTSRGLRLGVGPGRYYVLGLMRAHWDSVFWSHVGDVELVNMGIGMVQPVQDIVEALAVPEIRDLADSLELKWLAIAATSVADAPAEATGPGPDAKAP
jgi:hypothetical protein